MRRANAYLFRNFTPFLEPITGEDPESLPTCWVPLIDRGLSKTGPNALAGQIIETPTTGTMFTDRIEVLRQPEGTAICISGYLVVIVRGGVLYHLRGDVLDAILDSDTFTVLGMFEPAISD